MEYGLQLYSVQDFCDTDMDYALSRLGEFGYKFVEFAGFFDNTADDVKSMLDKYNFGVIGAHIKIEELEKDFDGIVEFNRKIGNKNIVVPVYEIYSKERVDELVEKINKFQPMLEKEGMKLHYHNHDQEFKANKDGVIPFDVLVEKTNVLFEIDTFWAYFAGRDPVALIDEYRDRIELVHIKDGTKDRKPKSLGEGFAPVADSVNKALSEGLSIIVESEGYAPDGISEVKRCYKFLRKMSEEANK